MKKTKYLITTAVLYATLTTNVHAQTPGFNNEEAKAAVKAFIQPLTTFGLWAIPVVALAALLFSALVWLTKDEDERENKPYAKTAKKIIIVAVVSEMMPVILKIFGL